MQLRNMENKGQMARSMADILTEEDRLGLLSENTLPSPEPQEATRESQTIANFKTLVEFYLHYRREPIKGLAEERRLANWLVAYRTRADLRAKVLAYDTVGLLHEKSAPRREVASLADIFEDDDLGLLDEVDSSIFNMNHARPAKKKDLQEEMGTSKPCTDFYRYEKFFQDLQDILRSKSVMLERFSRESDASPGQVFILRGLLCYVDSIISTGRKDTPLTKNSGGLNKANPRFRVIFANARETDLLKLSLARALYKDPHSRRVNVDPNLFSDKAISITRKDSPTGFIYILGTESTAPALAKLKAAGKLVKIGYSTQDIHERIKNAESERTYLEAPVRVLASIACYNLNPQKFENLIHAFLYRQRVHLALTGKDGSTYHPEEWFAVDRDTAVAVCEKIIDGSIVQYRMDNVSGLMMGKR